MTSRRDADTDAPSGVQSVDRAITVLEILARNDGAAVGEVALELGVHKSTASRLLSALEERDLVESDGERGRYRLGFGLLRLAGQAVGRIDIGRQADPIMQQLARAAGETVNLAVLRGHYAVNVADVRGPAAIAAQNWIGRLTPLHATASGKVLLAHESNPDRKRLLDAAGVQRYTSQTIVSRRALAEQLDALRRGDTAWLAAHEEYEPGLAAVAAAVRDHAGRVVAALSVSGPSYRLDAGNETTMATAVVRAAGEISARIGYAGS